MMMIGCPGGTWTWSLLRFCAAASPIFLVLFFLQLLEVVVEAVEALLPELAVGFDPAGDLPQGLRLDLAGAALRIAAARDEPCVFQDLQMLRDVRQRHVER